MATRMQQRRGTAAQWTSANPILNAGEIGFESDNNKFKIGDGVNHWADLNYFVDADTLIDGAPGLLDTLNELAAAIGDDPSFFTTVATNLSNHQSDTTSIHGIADTAELATKTFAAELLTNATKSNITITGNKNGLTITAENGVADSTTDNLTEGSTNKYFTDERAQDAVGNAVGTGLTYTDSTGEIKVTPNTYDAYGSASTVAGDLSTHASDTTTHGTTGDIVGTSDTQTLTNKTLTSPKINEDVVLSATATELNTLDGITASTAELNILDGATLSTTELNYVDGVTSAIQTQLNDKAPLASPTFTGTATVDDLEIGGALTFTGTATQIDSTSLTLTDPMIYMGEGNTANINDLGFVAAFNDGTYQHSGFVRDASAGTWKLFKGVTDEPTSTVNFTQGSLDDIQVGGLTASSITVGDVSNTEFGYLNGVTSAIQTQIDAKLSTSTAASTYQPLVSGVSDTEIGYLDGVTSAIQTQLDGKSPTAGSSSITTLGTVTTGTWSASTIALNKGGTGATTQAGAANAVLPSQASANGKYLTSDGTNVSWGTVSSYSAPTLGSTSIGSGATVTTITGLTLNNSTLTGTLTAASSAGTSGQVLSSTGTGVQWVTPAGGAAFSELMLIGA